MKSEFSTVKCGLLVIVFILMGFKLTNKAHADLFTPQLGNGPFADGRIGRNLLGTVYAPQVNDPILVGDDSGPPGLEVIYRSFIGFDLSSISDSQVTDATLNLSGYQSAANIESVLVDWVDFGNLLDSDDYDISAIQSNIGSFSAVELGYQNLDVTDVINSSLASGLVQFRLRAEIEQSMSGQNIVFFNGVEDLRENGEIPFLNVTPVPEPSTLFLLSLGLISVAGIKRRKVKGCIKKIVSQ